MAVGDCFNSAPPTGSIFEAFFISWTDRLVQAKTWKRRTARLKGKFPVHVEVMGIGVSGTVCDFSEYGMFIEAETLIDPGNDLKVTCKLPKKGDTVLEGKVRWIRKTPVKAATPEPKGMGIEISKSTSSYNAFVQRFRAYLEESRRSGGERVDVVHEVTFESGSHFISEYCENLSRGGMYLATDEELGVGKVIRAKLAIPGAERPIEVEGRIAYRLEKDDALAMGRSAGVGFQFVDLSQEATAHLTHYLKRLEIHRYDPGHRRSNPIPSSGSLSDYLVPEILLGFLKEETTGRLVMSNGPVKKTIYFNKGFPIYVESSLRSETLGYYLQRQGIISDKEHEKALESYCKSDLKFGETLVQKEILDAPSLAKHLVAHQEEKLYDTFPWFNGTFEFTPGSDWPDTISFFPLRTHEVVFTGIQRWYDSAIIQAWMGLNEESVVKAISSVPTTLNLPPQLFRLLRAVKKPRKVEELSVEVELKTDQILPLLFGLIIADLIDMTEEIPSKKGEVVEEKHKPDPRYLEQLQERINKDFDRISYSNFYEIFGPAAGRDEHALSERYFEICKPYVESELEKLNNPLDLEKAHHVLAWVRIAFETLKDPNMRQIYSRRGRANLPREDKKKQVESDRLLFECVSLLNRTEVDQAVEQLKRASKAYPEDYSFTGYLGWALFQQDPSQNLQRACDYLDRAIARQPSDAQLRFFRAEIHTHLGNWRDAEDVYRKALKLQPNFVRAEARLDHVMEKRVAMERIARDKFKEEL